MRGSGGSDDRERAVTTGHPERIRAAGHGLIDQAAQVLVAAELDDLDALLLSALSDARTRGGAPPDLGLTKSTGVRGGSAASRPVRHDGVMPRPCNRSGQPC